MQEDIKIYSRMIALYMPLFVQQWADWSSSIAFAGVDWLNSRIPVDSWIWWLTL